MQYYAYKGNAKLGYEDTYADDKLIIKDARSTDAAIKRCRKQWDNNFSLYTFSNFNNTNSFRNVYIP